MTRASSLLRYVGLVLILTLVVGAVLSLDLRMQSVAIAAVTLFGAYVLVRIVQVLEEALVLLRRLNDRES